MKRFFVEYGCMLFGHEDGPALLCIHCGTPNPWLPMTPVQRLARVFHVVGVTFVAVATEMRRLGASLR